MGVVLAVWETKAQLRVAQIASSWSDRAQICSRRCVSRSVDTVNTQYSV
jgi:hypothetical protein